MGEAHEDEERVDVLIVTAVKEEWNAVLTVDTGAKPGSAWETRARATGPAVSYRTFTTEGGALRFAVVQAFEMGGEHAVIAAAPLLEQHPEIRCLAMCGVCAGRRGDVALGDVIVADRTWPYDAGKLKVSVDEHGQRTERLHGDMDLYRIHPPEWKQQAERFQPDPTAHWVKDRPRSYEEQADWVLERLIRNDPTMHADRPVKCPDWDKVLKQLWEVKWLKKDELKLTKAGRARIRSRINREPDGLREAAPFKATLGPIASGAPVVQDPTIFDRLAETAGMRKVIGLEMETSAILALAYLRKVPHAVVMKGVMDHADVFKSDNMKAFAAKASAECLIAFLRKNLPPREPKHASPGSPPTVPLGRLKRVPDVPSHVVARPALLRWVKSALLAGTDGDAAFPPRRVGIHGMGGIGKSVLARQVVNDAEVRHAFPDGVIWVSLGVARDQAPASRRDGREQRAARDLADLQDQVTLDVGGSALHVATDARARLEDALAGRAVLLVLDDVQDREQAEAFNVLDSRCRILITTRDAGLAASFCGPHAHYGVDFLGVAQCRSLLARAAGLAEAALPPEADQVIAKCGQLPLALALCGGMQSRGIGWTDLLSRLEAAALDRIADRNAIGAHASLWTTLKVSFDALSASEQQHFLDLRAFRGAAPESAVRMLWSHTGALSGVAVNDLLISLTERSIIQLSGEAPMRWISVHDLLHDFARSWAPDLAAAQRILLAAYRGRCPAGWSSGPDDGYFFQHLAAHLDLAGYADELMALLEDARWRRTKRELDPSLSSYVADVELGVTRAESAEPPDYPSIAALSLVAARAREQVQDVPLDALYALTRLGRWRHALAYVPSIDPPERRLYALRQVAELLWEIGDADAFRSVVAEGLRVAEVLDPTLAQVVPLPVERALAQLEERCASDETTTVIDAFVGKRLEGAQLDEYRATVEKIGVLHTRFVLLAPRFGDATAYEARRTARELLPDHLNLVNFPRSDDSVPRDYELAALERTQQLAPWSTQRIDVELVRGVAGELFALIDQPDKALAVAATVRRPMNRFPAMATAAQAFGRAGQLQHVQRIWTMLKDLDTERYVGAIVERCDLLLRMDGAFSPFDDARQTEGPLGKALILALLPGVLDPSPPNSEQARDPLRASARRECLEWHAKDHGGYAGLARIQAPALVVAGLLKYRADDGAARLYGNLIGGEVESATPESWRLQPSAFQQQQTMAFSVLGTIRFQTGDVAGAESAWRRAVEMADQLESKHHRAQALAMAADAFARAGWRTPAEAFCRQFLSLMETPRDMVRERERLLGNWSAACVESGRIEEGLGLAERAQEGSTRLDAQASAALALARAEEPQRATLLLQRMLETRRACAHDAQAAAAMAKAIVAFCGLGDATVADELESEALSLAQGVEREPARLDALVGFIETLTMEGEGARAARIVKGYGDAATRSVMLAALARAAIADSAHIETSDFVNIAGWVVATVAVEVDQAEYHVPLALLILSDALRLSGKALEVASSIAFEGDLMEKVTEKALGSLSVLARRDEMLGTLRCYSVLRIAARLHRLTPKVLEQRSILDLWSWAQSQRQTSSIATHTQFVDALRSARSEDVGAVWAKLAISGPVLARAGAADPTWTRIEAMSRAQLSVDGDDRVVSGSMANLFTESLAAFRKIATATAASDFRERHMHEDDDTQPLARDALHRAVGGNDEARIVRLLDRGVDVNQADDHGETALMYAAVLGLDNLVTLLLARGADPNRLNGRGYSALAQLNSDNAVIAELLIKAGANVNHRTPDGHSLVDTAFTFKRFRVLRLLLEHGAEWVSGEDVLPPLFFAIDAGRVDLIEVLAKRGADVTSPAVQGFTPLMFAALGANEATVRALVRSGAPVDGRGIRDASALLVAADKPDEAVIRALVELGASIDLAKDDGVTALILVVMKGDAATARVLLDLGADIEIRTAAGRTAIGAAAAAGHETVVRLLLERGANVDRDQDANGATPLMLAAGGGHVGAMAVLFECGVRPDQATRAGWTALMSAAWRNQPEAAQCLLDHGAAIDASDRHGSTALTVAAGAGHDRMIGLLLHRGAAIDHARTDGATALCIATRAGHTVAVETLIERGADLDHGGEAGATALIIAGEYGHCEIVRRLLARGASLDRQTVDGTTALMAAAAGGHDDIVDALLAKGADMRQTTEEGGVALMFAAQDGHLNTVKLLVERGADVCHTMNDGRTALDFAEENEHDAIVQFLEEHLISTA